MFQRRNTFLNSLVAVGLAVLSSRIAQAQTSYTFTDLGQVGFSDGQSLSVNSSGHVLGMATSGLCFWSGGAIQNLGVLPTGAYLRSGTLNDWDEAPGYGDIMNNSVISGLRKHAFVWFPTPRLYNPALPAGTLIDLNSLLSPADAAVWVLVNANSVNNNHVVTGQGAKNIGTPSTPVWRGRGYTLDLTTGVFTEMVYDGVSVSYYATLINSLAAPQIVGNNSGGAFFYNNGVYTSLGSFSPFGLNDLSEVVGNYNQRAYYWNPTLAAPGIKLADITGTGVTTASGFSINNSSVIVGVSGTKKSMWPDPTHAMRWSGPAHTMTDLNNIPTGRGTWILINSHSVSNAGHIVGVANSTAQGTCFLLTPNP